MQIVFSGFCIPANEGVSGFDLPGSRAPTQTGHGLVINKGDVLEMIALRGVGSLCLYEPEADNLTIAEVMVLSCPVRKKGEVMYWSKIEYIGR